MTYSVWLVPTPKDARYLNQIINSLAKKYNAPKFEAHITIFSGITSLDKAKSILDTLRLPIIRVRCLGIGHSDYLWKTIFIRIKKDDLLHNVNMIFTKNLKTSYQFKPHISLIYKNLDHATKRKIIAGLNIKKSFSFDRIIIIQSSKSVQKWKKQYMVRLNATKL